MQPGKSTLITFSSRVWYTTTCSGGRRHLADPWIPTELAHMQELHANSTQLGRFLSESRSKLSPDLNFPGRSVTSSWMSRRTILSNSALQLHFLLNSGFRILTLSSHVLPRRIRLPFELLCHRDTDELVIIATRLILLGKKACPSDTLPVLWRGQRRDGFAGLISRLQLWCLRERGGGGGLKPMCNLMELPPAHKSPNQSL